jgi:membrane protease YdiL (CAAX protease family)
MTPHAPAERSPVREALVVWGGLMAALALAKATLGLLPFGGQLVGVLAVALFLWLPGEAARRARRPEGPDPLTLDAWPRDALFAALVMLVVFPPFALLFRWFLGVLDTLPRDVAGMLAPYGLSRSFTWRAPPKLVDLVGGNIAVAIGEEYFYRGYIQERLSTAWPAARRLLGVPFGRAALIQTALFAAGHLLTPQPFRLSTFFPGLLFTWMALRCGRVLPGVIVHAASNVFIATLEASAFGR